jgi:hypothetical protein
MCLCIRAEFEGNADTRATSGFTKMSTLDDDQSAEHVHRYLTPSGVLAAVIAFA